MLKRCAQYIFLCLAALPWVWWKTFSLLLGSGRAFTGVSQFLALFPGASGCLLRAAFYRLALADTSQDIAVEFLTTFSHPGTRLAAHVSTGTGCNIGLADIGEHSLIGTHTCVLSGRNQHDYTDTRVPIHLQGGLRKRVHIGRDCWIGSAAVIMADVGDGAVVAAGSVVIRPVPPYAIVFGVPARVVGSRLARQTSDGSSEAVAPEMAQETEQTPQ